MTTIRSSSRSSPGALSMPSISPIQRLARRVLFGALSRLSVGRLTIVAGDERHVFGASDQPDLEVVVHIHDSRAFPAVAFGGSVGAGEAYMAGWWHSDRVPDLIELLLMNREALESMDRRPLLRHLPFRRMAYWLQRNTQSGSRKNIAAHYDLSNDFFALFLDRTMTYSCAIFEPETSSLEQASIEKLDRACRKLDLQPGDRLLEIGTGWGSMAMHAAARYGCRVTTTTISREQARLARQRIEEAGLGDRITVLEQDYRVLQGRFDKIVSIEMIEAVGSEHYETFFRACDRLLKPDGLMLLQSIVIRDQHFESAAKDRDWLKKYIFPGSCLPSIGALQRAIAVASGLRMTHLEDIGPHYATTLKHWRNRFLSMREDVRRMGFDEQFIRMWEYYLAYCEGAFQARHTGDVQMLLAMPRARHIPYTERASR